MLELDALARLIDTRGDFLKVVTCGTAATRSPRTFSGGAVQYGEVGALESRRARPYGVAS